MKRFLLTAIFLVASPAFAATTDTTLASKGGFFENLGQVGEGLANRLAKVSSEQFTNAGMGYAANLVSPALAIAGALALMYLFFETLQYMAHRGSPPVQIALDVGVPAVIAASLIGSYSSRMAEFNALLDIFRYLAGDPAAIISRVVKLYASVLSLVSTCLSNAFSAVGSEVITAVVTLGMDSSVLLSLADLVATILFALLIVALVLLGLAEMVGLLLMGPFLFAVGVAFGPLFLAGLVTPWTREYTSRWAGFIVSAAILTGVMGVIVGISVTVFESLSFSAVTSGASDTPAAVHLAMAAILLVAINSLMAQAPAIASAMSPGSFGARRSSGAMVAEGVGNMRRSIASTARVVWRFSRRRAAQSKRRD